MLIAITGTPGCGKTTASKILENRGYLVKSVKSLSEENDCISGYDPDMESNEIDLEKLNEFVTGQSKKEDCLIEGHLSHLLSVDKVIILRCDPVVLNKRLESKGWKDKKIKENVRAEIMDVIKVEAYEEEHKVFEIDTTNQNPENVADGIERIIKGETSDSNIDWLEKYEYLLFE
jgi:adenylate kinase